MSELRLERLSKRYDTASCGVRDIDLLVGDGELLAVVGASGSGKTTLLRLIAGLEQPNTGSIFLGGRQVTCEPPWERDVALVSEAAALMPQLTIQENLDWSRRQRRRRGGEQASGNSRENEELTAARLAEMLGLTGMLGRRPAELSAGQQQRVALGRALASRPRVLLLDEPLGRIDGPGRQSLACELRRIQRLTKSTWIYVTHDRQEAVTVADRVAVLDEGRLLQVGTERELRRSPRHVRVMAWWWDGWLSGLMGRCEVVELDGMRSVRFRAPQLPEIGLPVASGDPVVGGEAVVGGDPVAGGRAAVMGQAVASGHPVAGGNAGSSRPILAVWPSDRLFVRLPDRSGATSVTQSVGSETLGPNARGTVAVGMGRVIERRDREDRAWALVALEPFSGGGSALELRGSGDWEISFAAGLARGWVWGRIQGEFADSGGQHWAHSAEIEVGSRVAVDFHAGDACWFER